MIKRPDHSRILIYSHDSFGLGHLRRCRAIAHALVERDDSMSVLILSGSPIIGSFEFRSRVDFVRVPGVIKLRNGEYTALNLNIGTEATLELRASIIEHTAEAFDPDLFLVDKEPLGLRGEVRRTLERLKEKGTPTALGLRDVMDDPFLLRPEWERKNVGPALEALYDHIWIYGLPQICNPLEGIDVPASVLRKISYTGYLRRATSGEPAAVQTPWSDDAPYLLVTPGGGGDGEAMVDWVLRAYEAGEETLPWPALIVLGPFMQRDSQQEFLTRVGRLTRVEAITFDANLEALMQRAAGVVAMGGYNTFCEILSFDKRALLIPRSEPRLEQTMRAARAQELGLVRMISHDDHGHNTGSMVAALQALAYQPPPSERVVPGLLEGLDNVYRLVMRSLYGAEIMPLPKDRRRRA